jgi:hypothetical protein
MNRTEHLLWVLAEECAEVAQRASKAARFGLDEVQPGQALTNEERLWQEMCDLCAVGEMLISLRGQGGLNRGDVDAKKAKVEKFLLYSAECGTYRPERADGGT